MQELEVKILVLLAKITRNLIMCRFQREYFAETDTGIGTQALAPTRARPTL